MRILLFVIEGSLIVLIFFLGYLEVKKILGGSRQKAIDKLRAELRDMDQQEQIRHLRRELEKRRKRANREDIKDIEGLLAEFSNPRSVSQTPPDTVVRVPERQKH